MNSGKLNFLGFPDHDVYNITAPFLWMGRVIIAGRVEKREEEISRIVFFEEAEKGWYPVKNAPTFQGLQDPCISRIDGKILLGGVRFPMIFGENKQGWQMEFFLEDQDGDFKKVLTGPPKMKDIRFLQLEDNRILILTRPQGDYGGRGKIGYCLVNDLQEATHDIMNQAPLFDHCPKDSWVGANEVHSLKNGQVGVLGHIAEFDRNQNRHYYSMVFSMDPKTGNSTLPKIIAKRSNFPGGDSKRDDLEDVIFSGGIHRLEDGKARLFAGLSDAEAGFLDIPDPFLEYES